MTKRLVSGLFLLIALGALGLILAGALSSGEQLIVRFLTAIVVAALGLYVISDLRLRASDDTAPSPGPRTKPVSAGRVSNPEPPPDSTAAFMATVTGRRTSTADLDGSRTISDEAAVTAEHAAIDSDVKWPPPVGPAHRNGVSVEPSGTEFSPSAGAFGTGADGPTVDDSATNGESSTADSVLDDRDLDDRDSDDGDVDDLRWTDSEPSFAHDPVEADSWPNISPSNGSNGILADVPKEATPKPPIERVTLKLPAIDAETEPAEAEPVVNLETPPRADTSDTDDTAESTETTESTDTAEGNETAETADVVVELEEPDAPAPAPSPDTSTASRNDHGRLLEFTSSSSPKGSDGGSSADRLPDPASELRAASYATAPIAAVVGIGPRSESDSKEINLAIHAGETEVISSLIEQGVLSTSGPLSDREVRTMVYVAFTSNELRKILLAGGTIDGDNSDVEMGPVELFPAREGSARPRPELASAGATPTEIELLPAETEVVNDEADAPTDATADESERHVLDSPADAFAPG